MGENTTSTMRSSEDLATLAAAVASPKTKGEQSTEDERNPTGSAYAAREVFTAPTGVIEQLSADRSQSPPTPPLPILAALVSTSAPENEPDQREGNGTQNNSPFRTDSSPTSSIDSNTTPNASIFHSAQPIPISNPPADPNRVITPLSGRGDRRASSYFSFAQSPPPRGRLLPIGSQQPHPFDDCSKGSIRHRRRSSSSHLSPSLFVLKMHPDQINSRYTPTSPLSPRLPPAGRPVSPQPSRARTGHRRQQSRNMQLNLPRYHPANFQSGHQLAMEASRTQNSTNSYHRMPQAESPRLMRERQRELIDRARMSSKIAASPMGIKPSQPTLAPLGSPQGIVTPLALEEAQDYFQVGGAGRVSPAQSPGAISNGSTKEFGEELAKKTPKPEAAQR